VWESLCEYECVCVCVCVCVRERERERERERGRKGRERERDICHALHAFVSHKSHPQPQQYCSLPNSLFHAQGAACLLTTAAMKSHLLCMSTPHSSLRLVLLSPVHLRLRNQEEGEREGREERVEMEAKRGLD
jgi:hypothetical protein